MKVINKVFVVTGAGSGMGRELSLQLIKKGARIAMADINEKGMSETAEMAGHSNISIHKLDISELNQVETFPATVIDKHGQVDGIINNAGIIQPFVNVSELDYGTIQRIMNINFYGTVNMTKTFLPHLLKRPEAYIANVASMGGFIPFPGQTIYGASKAAVKLFTEGLYAELKGGNVGVSVFLPGAVNTNIMANSGVKMEVDVNAAQTQGNRTLSAAKAAEIMIDAIEKDKFRALVGNDAKMLDLFYRFSPRRAVDFITKQMSKFKH